MTIFSLIEKAKSDVETAKSEAEEAVNSEKEEDISGTETPVKKVLKKKGGKKKGQFPLPAKSHQSNRGTNGTLSLLIFTPRNKLLKSSCRIILGKLGY